ncbi:MAG: hypothetical protein HY291_11180 [Planctomycetes bacterium]|nr:hypothetical protein [Planctomycetota bacterium]
MGSELDLVTDWSTLYNWERDPHRTRIARRISGELFPFEMPPLNSLDLLDQARRQPIARILHQRPGPRLDDKANAADRIRALPIEKAAEDPSLHLSLFDLKALTAPGAALHRFKREVFDPLESFWRERGVRWDAFLPVLFITGSASATNYHFDPDTTLPLHLFGRKRFHALKRPDYWCPREERQAVLARGGWPVKPAGITDDEVLVHENKPGEIVWIPVHTPHWVDAGSFSATLTFALKNCRFAETPLAVAR